jgi:uncharacterized protein YjbI with pentapeptide repeats
VLLTGADLAWLAEQSGRDQNGHVPNLHLERAYLRGKHLEGANLLGAHLEHADLTRAHLEHADLTRAHLEHANLLGAHLERAYLGEAHLEHARLVQAHLEGTSLRRAHLSGAFLTGANLDGAKLEGAYLVDAFLREAHLEGADLSKAYLQGTDLGGAWLDRKTVLSEARLDRKTRLGDIQWSGVGVVNLTRLPWDQVPTLGDEVFVGLGLPDQYEKAVLQEQVAAGALSPAWEHEAVVRAYRQLAAQLRAQGMTDVADRFAYRAQVWQRRVYLRRFRILQYLGSLLLDLISGYGYRPMRSFITYVLVILGFAATYFALGGAHGQPLTWNESIVVSMTAFHGRGFFAAVFQPGDVQAAVAAVEAFIGLLIEIVFIATFTQRFFAR